MAIESSRAKDTNATISDAIAVYKQSPTSSIGTAKLQSIAKTVQDNKDLFTAGGGTAKIVTSINNLLADHGTGNADNDLSALVKYFKDSGFDVESGDISTTPSSAGGALGSGNPSADAGSSLANLKGATSGVAVPTPPSPTGPKKGGTDGTASATEPTNDATAETVGVKQIDDVKTLPKSVQKAVTDGGEGAQAWRLPGGDLVVTSPKDNGTVQEFDKKGHAAGDPSPQQNNVVTTFFSTAAKGNNDVAVGFDNGQPSWRFSDTKQ